MVRNARLWQQQENIAEMLQAAGYDTAAFGKSLHSPRGGVADPANPLVPVGFDHYNVYDGADYIDPVTNLNGEAGHPNPGYATDLPTGSCSLRSTSIRGRASPTITSTQRRRPNGSTSSTSTTICASYGGST